MTLLERFQLPDVKWHTSELLKPAKIFPSDDFTPLLRTQIVVEDSRTLCLDLKASVCFRHRRYKKEIRNSRKSLTIQMLVDGYLLTWGSIMPFYLPETVCLYLKAIHSIGPGPHDINIDWKIDTGLVGTIDPKSQTFLTLVIEEFNQAPP